MDTETVDPYDTEDVKADYQLLLGIARDICVLAERILQCEVGTNGPGDFFYKLMINLIMIGQLHYLEDVIILAPKRTIEIIARTMVEGFIKLKWVEDNPEERSLRWFTYAWVQEWKTLIRESSRGKKVEEEKSELLSIIKERATIHLTPEGVKAIENNEELNPFGHFKSDWTGKSPYKLAEDIQEIDIYGRYFDPCNDWIHWSAKGLLKSANVDESGFNYSLSSYYQANGCLVGGIISIIGCIEIFLRSNKIEAPVELQQIKDRFQPWSSAVKRPE